MFVMIYNIIRFYFMSYSIRVDFIGLMIQELIIKKKGKREKGKGWVSGICLFSARPAVYSVPVITKASGAMSSVI